MSTETGVSKRRSEGATATSTPSASSKEGSDTTKHSDEQKEQQQQHDDIKDETNVAAAEGEIEAASTSLPLPSQSLNVTPGDGSRQVIAVSANKNPTAFFQLAKKFLMTNEMCDLSALEGAIVSAVDAAHLLERSQIASIVRIQTFYVNVEPKRRRQVSSQQQQQQQQGDVTSATATATDNVLPSITTGDESTSTSSNTKETPSSSVSTNIIDPNKESVRTTTTAATTRRSSSGGRELKRARILVTVKRTESYKRWLEANPLQRQAIIAGTVTATEDNIVNVTTATEQPSLKQSNVKK